MLMQTTLVNLVIGKGRHCVLLRSKMRFFTSCLACIEMEYRRQNAWSFSFWLFFMSTNLVKMLIDTSLVIRSPLFTGMF